MCMEGFCFRLRFFSRGEDSQLSAGDVREQPPGTMLFSPPFNVPTMRKLPVECMPRQSALPTYLRCKGSLLVDAFSKERDLSKLRGLSKLRFRSCFCWVHASSTICALHPSINTSQKYALRHKCTDSTLHGNMWPFQVVQKPNINVCVALSWCELSSGLMD